MRGPKHRVQERERWCEFRRQVFVLFPAHCYKLVLFGPSHAGQSDPERGCYFSGCRLRTSCYLQTQADVHAACIASTRPLLLKEVSAMC